jgi:hypothetical protein
MVVRPHCNDDELELYCGFFCDIVVNPGIEGAQFNEKDEHDGDDH